MPITCPRAPHTRLQLPWGALLALALGGCSSGSPAPAGGHVAPAPAPVVVASAAVTAAPTPSPSPGLPLLPPPSLPPGIAPEPIAAYGALSTLVGLGTSRGLPATATFGKDSNVGLPWGIQSDSQGTVYFVMLMGSGLVARQTGPESFTTTIGTGKAVAGRPLGFLTVFDFVPPGDDLVLAEKESPQVRQGRVVYVPRSGDSYAIEQAYNLDFGPIAVEQPSAVRHYRGRLYVSSADDTGNGPGASYVVEYDLVSRQSKVVAGTGTPGYAGDGGPATQARISPIDMGFGPESTPYEGLMVIADGGTNTLRAVNLNLGGSIDFHGTVIPAGSIATVAGKNSGRWPDLTTFTGEQNFHAYSFIIDRSNGGFYGDDGLASEARLNWPYAPRFDSRGRLYFLDADNHRLRVIDRHGVMHTIAGSVDLATNHDHRGFSSPNALNIDRATGTFSIPNGDGGDPRQGDINHPMDLLVREAGDGTVTFWIGETDALRYRVLRGFRWGS